MTEPIKYCEQENKNKNKHKWSPFFFTLFRCQVIYLAGQRPTNLGHHFYHCKVDGDLSHDRQIHTQTHKSPRGYGSTSFSEKTRRSNHLQMLEQRQHLLLNYFKTLSVVPAGKHILFYFLTKMFGSNGCQIT